MIGSRDQRRRIAGARLDVVQRRVPVKVRESLLLVGRSVFGRPRFSAGELLVPQHVHHADRGQRDGEQIGTLLHHRADEQAAVRPAHDAERLRRRVFFLDEVLCGRDEVVEDALLLLEHAGVVPCFAVLAAAAHVGRRPHAAALEPCGHVAAVGWQRGDIESAVAIQHRRIRAVPFQILAVRDEQRHARAVLRRREDPFGRVRRRIEGRLRRLERCALPCGLIEAKHGQRKERRREGVEHFLAIEPAERPVDRAEAGRHDAAGRRPVDVVELHFARDVDHPVHGQLPGDEVGTLDGVLGFGNDRLPVRSFRFVDGNRDDLAVRRVEIGPHVERAVGDAQRLVGRRVTGIECANGRIDVRRQRIAQILHEQLVLVARALVRGDPEVASRFVAVRVDEERRLVAPLVHQPVRRLWRAEHVVVDLLVAHRGLEHLAGRRLGIAPVEESFSVFGPRQRAELHEADHVGQLLAAIQLPHVERRPVRSAFGLSVQKMPAVGRRIVLRQRHGAVGRQLVRVDQHALGTRQRFAYENDRLTLQSRVARVEPVAGR